jgi:hypothetical protein
VFRRQSLCASAFTVVLWDPRWLQRFPNGGGGTRASGSRIFPRACVQRDFSAACVCPSIFLLATGLHICVELPDGHRYSWAFMPLGGNAYTQPRRVSSWCGRPSESRSAGHVVAPIRRSFEDTATTGGAVLAAAAAATAAAIGLHPRFASGLGGLARTVVCSRA